MSIVVKNIDEWKAQDEVEKCPKIVQDYVRSLRELVEIKDHTNKKALRKIREQSKEIKELKEKLQ